MKYKVPLTSKDNKELKIKLSGRISVNIKKIRKDKGLTQEEVAEKAGLHLTYIGHLEAGKYHPSTFVLWKIAKVLEVSLDSLTS